MSDESTLCPPPDDRLDPRLYPLLRSGGDDLVPLLLFFPEGPPSEVPSWLGGARSFTREGMPATVRARDLARLVELTGLAYAELAPTATEDADEAREVPRDLLERAGEGIEAAFAQLWLEGGYAERAWRNAALARAILLSGGRPYPVVLAPLGPDAPKAALASLEALWERRDVLRKLRPEVADSVLRAFVDRTTLTAAPARIADAVSGLSPERLLERLDPATFYLDGFGFGTGEEAEAAMDAEAEARRAWWTELPEASRAGVHAAARDVFERTKARAPVLEAAGRWRPDGFARLDRLLATPGMDVLGRGEPAARPPGWKESLGALLEGEPPSVAGALASLGPAWRAAGRWVLRLRAAVEERRMPDALREAQRDRIAELHAAARGAFVRAMREEAQGASPKVQSHASFLASQQ